MPVPHPIPYQGSKRIIAHHIINLIPRDTSRLIEPFAGSAAVSLAAAFHSKTKSFWINDLNQPLMKIWGKILDDPEGLADDYEQLWNAQLGREKSFYVFVRDRFNSSHQPGDFLYLLARCVKAAVRYNTNGEFNQSADNRRKGSQPSKMRRNILSSAELLWGKTTVTSLNYTEILRAAETSDVVYMDPPYQGVSTNRDRRYIDGLRFEDFVAELNLLNDRNIPFIVSYDGKTGTKTHGLNLTEYVDVHHIEVDAGTSSQATLLGRYEKTIESLFISPSLLARLERVPNSNVTQQAALEV